MQNSKPMAEYAQLQLVMCLIEGRSLEAALRTNYYQILEEMGQVPSNREYTAALAEEAIKNAIEDFYKKKEKEIKSKR